MSKWQEHWVERRRLLKCTETVVRRWQNGCLVRALEAFIQHCLQLRRMRSVGSKVVLRWRQGVLGQAWTGWRDRAAQQRRLAFSADKIIRRWLHSETCRAFCRWKGWLLHGTVVRLIGFRLLCAVKTHSIRCAWSQWCAHSTRHRQQKRLLRVVARNIILRRARFVTIIVRIRQNTLARHMHR